MEFPTKLTETSMYCCEHLYKYWPICWWGIKGGHKTYQG